MRAFRPLFSVIVIILAVTFVLQNTWMTEENSVGYRLFTYDFGNTAAFPIWSLVLAAFFLGYLLGWSVGRLDIMSLRGQLKKSMRRIGDLESKTTVPIAYNPAPDNTSKGSTV